MTTSRNSPVDHLRLTRATSIGLALRLAWWLGAALLIYLYFLSSLNYLASAGALCSVNEQCQLPKVSINAAVTLMKIGISPELYAISGILIATIFAMTCWVVAATIFWQKSYSVMAIVTATFLLFTGTTFSPTLGSVATTHPWLAVIYNGVSALTPLLFFLFFFLFPYGRFVPRWTLLPMLIGIAYMLSQVIFEGNPSQWVQVMSDITFVLLLFAALAACRRDRQAIIIEW